LGQNASPAHTIESTFERGLPSAIAQRVSQPRGGGTALIVAMQSSHENRAGRQSAKRRPDDHHAEQNFLYDAPGASVCSGRNVWQPTNALYGVLFICTVAAICRVRGAARNAPRLLHGSQRPYLPLIARESFTARREKTMPAWRSLRSPRAKHAAHTGFKP
jgi:hypothetical protein